MVEQVWAYKAKDGSIYPTEQAATEADAMLALKQLDIFNHGSALAVVKHAQQLVEILTPVAAAQPKPIDHAERLANPSASETV